MIWIEVVLEYLQVKSQQSPKPTVFYGKKSLSGYSNRYSELRNSEGRYELVAARERNSNVIDLCMHYRHQIQWHTGSQTGQWR
jgi:hypothetical protein